MTATAGDPVQAVLAALAFASHKHRDQRRKGADATPFINHAIEVADLIARVGGVTDPATLQAAILHDTLEDTPTTPEEIEETFGPEVSRIVQEVTDDRRLPRVERRQRQEASAATLSVAAKQIRLADKISNVRAVTGAPPLDWSIERRLDYVAWTERVVAGCRGVCDPLERLYDEVLQDAQLSLRHAGAGQ